MTQNFQFGSSVGMLDKPYGELNSIPSLQSIVPRRQASIKFMEVTRSLQILSPALSSEASNVNVTDSDKEEDDLD